MARVELITWDDLITHIVDWMGANPTQEARRDARRASLHAIRDLAGAHNWTYYYTRGRLVTVAPYTTGTVTYDHTGGTQERLLTLSDGTWPEWAATGAVAINNVSYDVYSRLDASNLILSVNSNPGADITDPSSFILYRDNYSLPANFQAMGEIVIVSQSRILQQEHPSTWLSRQRIWRGMSIPFSYTILGDPNYQNTLSIAFYPPPDNQYTMDYLYKRRSRPLRIDSYSAGTLTVTAGGLSATVSGGKFEPGMCGSVLRTGTITQAPTSRWGSYPAQQERVIVEVVSETVVTVDSPWDTSQAGVKYLISDPVDVEVGSMLTALLRRAELECGHARNKADRELLDRAYHQALIQAREMDSRNFTEQSVGSYRIWPLFLRDFPRGPDM